MVCELAIRLNRKIHYFVLFSPLSNTLAVQDRSLCRDICMSKRTFGYVTINNSQILHEFIWFFSLLLFLF